MKQVQFEFDRLFGTAMYMSQYLAVQITPTAKAGPVDREWGQMFCLMLSDAVLGDFLVHARNLIDFFLGPTSQRPDDIVAAGDHRAPPLLLDVLLEFHTQWPVVPRRAGATVDLPGLVDQAPPLGEIDDGVDDGRHETGLLCWGKVTGTAYPARSSSSKLP